MSKFLPIETNNGFTGTYRFLSNFYPCLVEYEREVYPSTEHAYQAAKTLDWDLRKRFTDLDMLNPGTAKRKGRSLVLRPDWEDVKLGVMADILSLKFSHAEHSELVDKLLDTRVMRLVEYNYWHDLFWGKCTCDQHNGQGKNMLGNLLMALRQELANKSKVRKVG